MNIIDLTQDGSRPAGGTRKIADLISVGRCDSSEHNPPSHQVFTAGVYEHVCPRCGNVIQFVVNPPTF